LFTDANHCDYIFDSLYIGAILGGHTVHCYPKPNGLYNCGSTLFYSRVNGFFKNILSNYTPIEQIDDDYDAIIFESAGIPYRLFPTYKEINMSRLWNSSTPKVCVLGNDTFTYQPLPNMRYDYHCKMAIREKYLQTPIVNTPFTDDFPLHFTIPRSWIRRGNEQPQKSFFFSMGLSNPTRKEIGQYFINQHYTALEAYLHAISNHKYGISIFGDGLECQREPEIGANTLLAIYQHPRSIIDSSYYNSDNSILFKSYDDLIAQTKMLEHTGSYEELRKKCMEFTAQNLTCESQLTRLLRWLLCD
jgi:hypothetical protein